MLKIQSWGRMSILQEDCNQKNISVLGINISLRVIDFVILNERTITCYRLSIDLNGLSNGAKTIVLNVIGNRRHHAIRTQRSVIQIMKKFTSIIGEVGPTYAHLIQESDRYLAIRSQQTLAIAFEQQS
jgi:hypothetical protein